MSPYHDIESVGRPSQRGLDADIEKAGVLSGADTV